MRKTIITIVILGFLAAIVFFGFVFVQFYKNSNKPKSANEIANLDYYYKHNKSVTQNFVIDSIAYNITDYDFYMKPHSLVLVVGIVIKNTTKHSKQFSKYFFEVNNGPNEIFYPSQEPFSVFENRTQKIKLIYNLPERILPYIRYEIHLRSNQDDKQNALVILYKSYREGG
jgi:hypothetical protein